MSKLTHGQDSATERRFPVPDEAAPAPDTPAVDTAPPDPAGPDPAGPDPAAVDTAGSDTPVARAETARTTAPGRAGSARAGAHRARPRPIPDLVAFASYLAGAILLTGRLWVDVPRRVPVNWLGDRALSEWYLAFAARAVSHLENPFFSTRMNAPAGVNLMANTSVLGLGIPAAPITLLFGPAATFDTLIVVGLAGTATAWYYVLSRHLVTSRAVAWAGGLVCGFAPSMSAHTSWHPNLVAQFLVPFIAWRAMRLREPGRPLRNGTALGLLIVWQAFINEEVLFLTALACGLFVVVYASTRRHVRDQVRPFLAGLSVAALVAAVLLAYPLWTQFRGPGSYHGIVPQFAGLRTDALGYTSFASNSVARQLDTYPPPVRIESEDNAYLGWPLVLFVAAIAGWLRREAVVRAAAVTAAAFAVLSFGPELIVRGRHTGVPGPWRLLQQIPIFNLALPIRLGLVTTPLVGLLLAYGCERLLSLRPAPGSARYPLALLVGGLVAAVLVPMAPLPVPAVGRPPTPQFVAGGTWRRYVGPDESVLVVPMPSFDHPDGLWWSAQTGLDLRLSHGYFLGPGRDGSAVTGAPNRPTDELLIRAVRSGTVPTITDADRARASADFAYWRTAIVVLRPDPGVPDTWRGTLDALIGRGQFVGGVWVWDVRGLR